MNLYICFALLAAAAVPLCASANVASVFGIGPLSMSMGATSFVVGEYDSFTVYTAPAALGYITSVEASAGFMNIDPRLKSFGTLTINSAGTQGDFNDSGVLPGTGETLGLAFPIGKKEHPVTIGAAFFLPSESVARVSSNGVNYPFYPMYTDISRNAFYVFGLGYRVWRGISAGINVRSSIKSYAKYELRSDNSINHSASAVEARTESRLSFSAMYDTSFEKAENPYAVGLTYRAESTMDSKLSADIDLYALPVQGTLTSTALFSPAEWVLATSKRFDSSGITVSFDGSWVKWSHYTSPYGTGSLNYYVIGDLRKEAGFKDVFVPRIGVQKETAHSGLFKKIAYRLGYFYYPTPVPDQTGDSNFVDTNRHTITGGVGGSLRNPWSSTENPIRIDLYAQYNRLTSRNISKQASTNVGAPGYTAGGQIWVYGLAGTISF